MKKELPIFFRTARGFTLVEVMFGTVIGVLIIGMIMILYMGVQNSMIIGLSLAEINGNARLAMDRIVRDLRWGVSLETTRTIDSVTYQTADDEIIIKMNSIDSDGDVISNTFDYVVYALDASVATRLRKIVDADAASNRSDSNQIIAVNIDSFELSSEGTGLASVGTLSSVESVEVSISADKTPIEGKTITHSLDSEAEIRNN